MFKLQITLPIAVATALTFMASTGFSQGNTFLDLYNPANDLDPTQGGNLFTAIDINEGTDLDLDGDIDSGSGNVGPVSSDGITLDKWQIDDTDDDNSNPTYYYDLSETQVTMMNQHGFSLTWEADNITGGQVTLGVNREFKDQIFGYTIFEIDGLARFTRSVPGGVETWSWEPATSTYIGPVGQSALEPNVGPEGGGRIMFAAGAEDLDAAHFNILRITLNIYGAPLIGDVNGDGFINLLDVGPFVALLSQGEFQVEADINGDGSVNLLDVDPFVTLLSGG